MPSTDTVNVHRAKVRWGKRKEKGEKDNHLSIISRGAFFANKRDPQFCMTRN